MIGVILDFIFLGKDQQNSRLSRTTAQSSSLFIALHSNSKLPTLFLKTGYFNFKELLKIAGYCSLQGIVSQRQCIFWVAYFQ